MVVDLGVVVMEAKLAATPHYALPVSIEFTEHVLSFPVMLSGATRCPAAKPTAWLTCILRVRRKPEVDLVDVLF